MSLRRSVVAAVATVSIASAASASPWALRPGEFYSELTGSFFSANSFYGDQNQGRVSLGGRLDERVLRSYFDEQRCVQLVSRITLHLRRYCVSRGLPFGGIASSWPWAASAVSHARCRISSRSGIDDLVLGVPVDRFVA